MLNTLETDENATQCSDVSRVDRLMFTETRRFNDRNSAKTRRRCCRQQIRVTNRRLLNLENFFAGLRQQSAGGSSYRVTANY